MKFYNKLTDLKYKLSEKQIWANSARDIEKIFK